METQVAVQPQPVNPAGEGKEDNPEASKGDGPKVSLEVAMAGQPPLTDAESQEYADKIRNLYAEYLSVGRVSTQKALALGDLLNEVKDRLPRGSFGPWLKREVGERGGYGLSRCKQFRRLARASKTKRAEYVLLPLSDALEAAGIAKYRTKKKNNKKKPGEGKGDKPLKLSTLEVLPVKPEDPSPSKPSWVAHVNLSDQEALVADWIKLADNPETLADWIKGGLLLVPALVAPKSKADVCKEGK
ncbi:MAG: hypothetical protein M5U26_11645 [Planctomycetota bacterium]|nr:hypothetical protein [Planctomycetota bacterium]